MLFDNQIFFKKIARFSPYSKDILEKLAWADLGFIESFDRGKITPREFYKKAVEKLNISVKYEDFYSVYCDVFSLNSPVLEIMKRLKANYRLILLSNTDVMRFGFIRKKFPETMIFDEYVLSFEVGFMKPHPRIYKDALKKAEAKAEECVFIDDREENIDGAEKLGMKGVLFDPRMNLEASLKKLGLVF